MKQIFLLVISLLLLPSCNKDDDAIGIEPPTNIGASIRIVVGSTTFIATLYDNATATAFRAMLPFTLHMSDFNNNEKVCSLPNSLTISASNPGTIQSGDIMLYGSSALVLFYETFSTSYSYTKIGRVDDVSGLKAALGAGSITVKFELE